MKLSKQIHPLLWIIVLTAPFILWGKLLILPTFDDWATLSSPNTDADFLQFFLPYGSSWRPFDALIGYVYSWIGPQWFPTLSHLLIFAAHAGSTFMVFRLSQLLGFSRLAQAVATVFFWLSPCTLATVFACDSLNQSYSQFWGLMAIYSYLRVKSRWRHHLWLLCVLLATLSKENGLAWAVVPPILAFGFQFIDRRTLFKHLALGCTLAIAYAAVRLSLPLTEVYYEEYHNLFSLAGKIKAVAVLLCYTFLPGDYIFLLHAPARNVGLFLLTLLPVLPFIWMLFFYRPSIWRHRHFLTLLLCALIAVSPNLLITMIMMNAYTWLGMAALLVAFCVNHCQKKRAMMICFLLYLAATAFTYVHHWYCTWQTSLPARYMAEEAICKTGHRVDNVFVITIEETERKYSSFITLPTEAFGWGRAVWGQTNYEWPSHINDTIVPHNTTNTVIDSLARQALQTGNDCVWVVRHDSVFVITSTTILAE